MSNATVDIIAGRLALMDVKLEQRGPYDWSATIQLDRMIYTARGFEPGDAVNHLYGYVLRVLDQDAAGKPRRVSVPVDENGMIEVVGLDGDVEKRFPLESEPPSLA